MGRAATTASRTCAERLSPLAPSPTAATTGSPARACGVNRSAQSGGLRETAEALPLASVTCRPNGSPAPAAVTTRTVSCAVPSSCLWVGQVPS